MMTVSLTGDLGAAAAMRLAASMKAVENMTVRIGLPDSEKAAKRVTITEDNGDSTTTTKHVIEGKLTLAQLGLIQEFGIPGHIPSRPFMRSGLQRAKAGASKLLGKLLEKLDPKVTGEQLKTKASTILGKVGAYVAAQIKQGIASGGFAANAPSTVARKGSSKPLIDTGLLRQSLTWQVRS